MLLKLLHGRAANPAWIRGPARPVHPAFPAVSSWSLPWRRRGLVIFIPIVYRALLSVLLKDALDVCVARLTSSPKERNASVTVITDGKISHVKAPHSAATKTEFPNAAHGTNPFFSSPVFGTSLRLGTFHPETNSDLPTTHHPPPPVITAAYCVHLDCARRKADSLRLRLALSKAVKSPVAKRARDRRQRGGCRCLCVPFLPL